MRYPFNGGNRSDKMHSALAPDLILANGRVITADANNRTFEAVAVKMGRILAVGDSSEMLDLRGTRTEVIDLKGRTVIPGLTDPHVHLADDGAASLNKIDVRDFGTNVRSIPHILEVVRAQTREVPPGTWIVGTGSPMQDFRMPEKRFPRREELDAVAPDHPVSIGFGAHVTIANSRALALAHVTKETTPPGGGAIELDPATGELTGKLIERAQYLVRDVIPAYSYEQMKEGIVHAMRRALRRGVTTIHDIVTNNETVRAYQELVLEGRLPIRASLLLRILEAKIVPESLLNLGIKTGFGNDWLKIGGVKMSIDGGITGRVAAFYRTLCRRSLPLRPHPHSCRGTRRNRRRLSPRRAPGLHSCHRRPRDGHGARRHREGRDGAAARGSSSPRRASGQLDDHQGAARTHSAGSTYCRCRTCRSCTSSGNRCSIAWDRSGWKALSTSRRCSRPVFRSRRVPTVRATGRPIRCATWARRSRARSGAARRSASTGRSRRSKRLRMFTINAAYNGFDERIKGSIEPGKLADLAVLAQDPLAIAPERIKDIPVDMTIVDGRVAFVHEGVQGL